VRDARLTVTLQEPVTRAPCAAMNARPSFSKRRLRDKSGIRDALDRLIPDGRRRRSAAGGRRHRGNLRESPGQARTVREARSAGEAGGAPRHEYVKPQARRHRREIQEPVAPRGNPFLQPGAADAAVEVVFCRYMMSCAAEMDFTTMISRNSPARIEPKTPSCLEFYTEEVRD